MALWLDGNCCSGMRNEFFDKLASGKKAGKDSAQKSSGKPAKKARCASKAPKAAR